MFNLIYENGFNRLSGPIIACFGLGEGRLTSDTLMVKTMSVSEQNVQTIKYAFRQ